MTDEPKKRAKGIGTGHHPGSKTGYGNLIPINERPLEEQRIIREKGVEASIAARKRRKTIAETIEIAMNNKIPEQYLDIKELTKEILGKKKTDKPTNIEGVVGSLFREAYSIDSKFCKFDRMKAFELIRDQVGENPDKDIGVTSTSLADFGAAMRANLSAEDEESGHVDEMEKQE